MVMKSTVKYCRTTQGTLCARADPKITVKDCFQCQLLIALLKAKLTTMPYNPPRENRDKNLITTLAVLMCVRSATKRYTRSIIITAAKESRSSLSVSISRSTGILASTVIQLVMLLSHD